MYFIKMLYSWKVLENIQSNKRTFNFLFRSIAYSTANGNMRLIRASSNISGPKQRQDRLFPPDRKAPYQREQSNQTMRGNKSNHLSFASNTVNTNSTTLASQFTNETTKVSCRNNNKATKAATGDIPIMDNSNSSCLTSVCVTPSKSNDNPSAPPINNTNDTHNNIITTTTTTRTTSTSSPNLDAKLHSTSETLVSSNQPCIDSGINTSSYCTTIVKSKSEW